MYSPELVRISSWLALQEELVELFIFRFDRKPLSLGTFNLKHVSNRASFLFAWAILQPAYADTWQPITETANLQALVAGATAEIQLEPGVIAVGKYHADGSAEIKA
jgi:hypothetical protein